MINKLFYIVVVLGTTLLSACSTGKIEQKVIGDRTVEDKVMVDDSIELTLF